MSDVPPPSYNHLKHLNECRLCFESDARPNQYMCFMFMSQGKLNAASQGTWFEKCLSNPGLCSGFQSVPGVPRGPRSSQDTVMDCVGRLCSLRQKARAGSNSCHIALCIACCVDAHVDMGSKLPPCRCSAHLTAYNKELKGIVAGSVSSSPSSTVRLPSTPGTSSTLSPLLPRSRDFSAPLSGTYKQRLLDLDNDHIELVTSVADNRSFKRQAEKTVTIMWWSEDGAAPDTMDVPAPQHPYFHPIDSSDMVLLYGVDTKPFESFHPVHQFRTRGVQLGIGMSQGSILRLDHRNRICGPDSPVVNASPNSNENFATDSRPSIEPIDFWSPVIVTPGAHFVESASRGLSPFTSPSPFRLPAAPDAAFSDTPFLHLTPSSSGPIPPSSSGSSSLVIEPPPLPSLSEELLTRIVAKAARGTSATGWPFIYTRDMAAGFVLLDNRGGRAASRPQDFQAAFGCVYKPATYSDNRRIWDHACRTAGVDAQTIIDANDKTDTWPAKTGEQQLLLNTTLNATTMDKLIESDPDFPDIHPESTRFFLDNQYLKLLELEFLKTIIKLFNGATRMQAAWNIRDSKPAAMKKIIADQVSINWSVVQTPLDEDLPAVYALETPENKRAMDGMFRDNFARDTLPIPGFLKSAPPNVLDNPVLVTGQLKPATDTTDDTVNTDNATDPESNSKAHKLFVIISDERKMPSVVRGAILCVFRIREEDGGHIFLAAEELIQELQTSPETIAGPARLAINLTVGGIVMRSSFCSIREGAEHPGLPAVPEVRLTAAEAGTGCDYTLSIFVEHTSNSMQVPQAPPAQNKPALGGKRSFSNRSSTDEEVEVEEPKSRGARSRRKKSAPPKKVDPAVQDAAQLKWLRGPSGYDNAIAAEMRKRVSKKQAEPTCVVSIFAAYVRPYCREQDPRNRL
ncbi:hypothetical protein C8R47DRAFT_1230532 [Mycena vitilis]|nr:hypothetical protein C8R47DRAFT_1230532 [Mycena vitilis]